MDHRLLFRNRTYTKMMQVHGIIGGIKTEAPKFVIINFFCN